MARIAGCNTDGREVRLLSQLFDEVHFESSSSSLAADPDRLSRMANDNDVVASAVIYSLRDDNSDQVKRDAGMVQS